MTFDTSRLMFKPDLLQGERILVTGGGSGLGAVMAGAYLALGAEVYICGRRGPVLQKTAQELMETHGGKVGWRSCNIREPDSIAALNDYIWDDGGPLTGLVNNAAGNFISRTEDLSVGGFNAIGDTVFRGTFYMTHDVGKRWIANGDKGSILSILTTWVWNGSPYTVPSAMSKTAVHAMTQSLAVEWSAHGIRLNAIAPAHSTPKAWLRGSIPAPIGRITRLCPPIPCCGLERCTRSPI